MRPSRTELVPVLAIIGGGAVGVLASASLLLSRAPDAVAEGVLWSAVLVDGRTIEYRFDENSSRIELVESSTSPRRLSITSLSEGRVVTGSVRSTTSGQAGPPTGN